MEFQNYIDGQWVGASDGQTFAQRNPADLECVTGEVAPRHLRRRRAGH